LAIKATPNGTYGTKMPAGKILRKLFEPMAKRGIEAYRRSGGKNRMSTMMGFPVVLLTTKGASSEKERIVQIAGFPDGDDAWLVLATDGGSPRHPAWYNNMVKHPDDISLEAGSRRMKVTGESLHGREREETLARIVAISPRFGGYQKKTDREIPIVRLTRISG
jgi:deazaflavin-dependent oxidoreductase (nitroreductase family)